MTSREPRAVVITGCSTGIGHAAALHLDSLGFRVFAGVRRTDDAERLAAEASERLEPLLIDVTDPASIEQAALKVRDVAGEGLGGLVNNAGVTVPGPFEFLALDELRRQLEVNFVGHVAVTQAFLPALRRARGRIVNVGSIGGVVANPFIGAYSASKFALEAFTDSLRRELRPWGIWVAILEPAAVSTAIWEKGERAGDELARSLPPEALELYGPAIETMRKVAAGESGRAVPPERAAKAIAHALTARRPRTRYVLGRGARARIFLARALPDRAFDRLVARVLRWDSE